MLAVKPFETRRRGSKKRSYSISEAAQEVEYDLTIDDQNFRTYDPVITGRDILSIASRSPASGYTVVSIVDRGTQSIGLDEQVDLRETASQRFRLFEGDRLFRAMLNES